MTGTRRPAWLAALALVAGGCEGPGPVRIGFVTGLSGRHYDLGISSRNGVLLGVADVNRAGGIHGRPIELVVRDDQQDPEAARRAVEEIIREGAVAIIGHATSQMAEATLPIVDRERVLMVSPTVSSSAFRGKDDWFVMLQSTTDQAAATLAEHLAQRKLGRRTAVIYDLSNRAYTQSWHDHFRAALEARGGRVAASIPFTSGTVESYSALAAAALRSKPDAILIVANALDSATLCQQVRKVSREVPLFGAEWGFTHDVLRHGGAAVEGAIFVQRVNVEDGAPALAAFRQAYRERFHRPADFAAVLSYEAVGALAEALRRDATRAGVRRALLEIGTFRGLQGEFRIDRNGDVQRPAFLMVVREGRMSVLE